MGKTAKKAKPAPPPPIDFAEVEAAVTRYAANRTKVKFNPMWRALAADLPALDGVRGEHLGPLLFQGCLASPWVHRK